MNHTKRIVIGGGSGLIGKAISKFLSTEGYEIYLLSRNPDKVKNLPVNTKAVHWDGKTLGDWKELIEDAYAVINLTGASIGGEHPLNMRWTEKRKRVLIESRVWSGKVITEAIQQANKKPRVMVQSSAVGYYGPLGEELVYEDFPPGNDFLANICKQWEESSLAIENVGIRRVIIRTGIVLSKESYTYKLLKMPFELFVGGPLGSGKQYLPWIHMDDEISAIHYLIENEEASGPYNFTAPTLTSNADFGEALGKSLKRPSLIRTPSFIFKLLLGEASTVILDGQRPYPKRLLDAGYKFQFPDLSSALGDLSK